ncbi:hypothetical protein DIPPA_15719 [Diplonema papillatum]|nr:hypothetical protein DIPPA_15719 [Diplonema papillatum]|eukprot:gene17345-26646_t
MPVAPWGRSGGLAARSEGKAWSRQLSPPRPGTTRPKPKTTPAFPRDEQPSDGAAAPPPPPPAAAAAAGTPAAKSVSTTGGGHGVLAREGSSLPPLHPASDNPPSAAASARAWSEPEPVVPGFVRLPPELLGGGDDDNDNDNGAITVQYPSESKSNPVGSARSRGQWRAAAPNSDDAASAPNGSSPEIEAAERALEDAASSFEAPTASRRRQSSPPAADGRSAFVPLAGRRGRAGAQKPRPRTAAEVIAAHDEFIGPLRGRGQPGWQRGGGSLREVAEQLRGVDPGVLRALADVMREDGSISPRRLRAYVVNVRRSAEGTPSRVASAWLPRASPPPKGFNFLHTGHGNLAFNGRQVADDRLFRLMQNEHELRRDADVTA